MRKKVFILFFLMSVLAAEIHAEGTNRFKVYSLGFSDPQAVESMARQVVGEDGNVTLDRTNLRLLVITTDENHARLAEMIGMLNVPPRNVRIDVHFQGQMRESKSGAEMGMVGGVVRTEGPLRTRISIRPRILSSSTEIDSDVTQTILVASGREGLLRVGEEVPYVEWLMDYGLQWGYIQQQISWQRVGSFLVVEPTIIGDGPMIRVRLIPELSGLVDRNPYRLRFTKLATEVIVQDGQTFPIGGLQGAQDFYSRFLVGFDQDGNQQSLDISLTPTIVEAFRPPKR